MSLLVFAIVVVVILDFAVTIADSAIFTVPMHRVKMLSKASESGVMLLRLRERSEEPITTIISLSNLITVVGSVVVGSIAEDVFGTHWVWLVAVILTLAMMVAGEIIPKRIGEQYAEEVALGSAHAMHIISKLFLPLTLTVRMLVKPFVKEKHATTSREEIAFLAKIGGEEGTLKESEGKMIRRIFKLNGITASDIMTPRPFLFLLDGNRTLGEVAAEVMSSVYSKMPVYDKFPEHIVGVVSQKAMLKAIAAGENGREVRELMEEPLVVPESRLGDNLIKDFQDARNNFAIVVDGRGHVTGVITLLDIIEELVGESGEEPGPQLIQRISKNEVIAHGETQISRINRFFNTNIPNHRTLDGFLLDQIGRMPKPGFVYKYDSLEFLIEDVNASLIEKVRIRKPELKSNL